MLDVVQLNRGSEMGCETWSYEPVPGVELLTEYMRFVFILTKKLFQDRPNEVWWRAFHAVNLVTKTNILINAYKWTDGKQNLRKRWSITAKSASRALVHKKGKYLKHLSLEDANTADHHEPIDDGLSRVTKLEGVVHSAHHLKEKRTGKLITKYP